LAVYLLCGVYTSKFSPSYSSDTAHQRSRLSGSAPNASMEDTMKEFIPRSKIAVGLAALVLGAAFSAAPAMAQYGRNVNDGGLVNVPGAQAQPSAYQYYNYSYSPAPTAYKYPVGRGVNDGGLVPEPPAVRQPRAAAAPAAPSAPHYGRPVNDGGLL
jgi:hypothetical protein